ncbi:MAG TPA: hypothetical protein VL125_12380 [Pelobium sp.]|nr:hypothetical protein [Pelobium sp.]
MAKIKIKVNLSEVNHIDVIARKIRFLDFKGNDFYTYATELEYNLGEEHVDVFLDRIIMLLTREAKSFEVEALDKEMIDKQVSQLLFAYDIIKQDHLGNRYNDSDRKDSLDFFERYIPLHKVLSEDNFIYDVALRIFSNQKTSKQYKLPIPKDISHFRSSLLKFFEAYYGENYTCRFTHRLGSPVDKTVIDEWNSFMSNLKKRGKSFRQDVQSIRYHKADVIRRLVPLIKNFPQFSKSKTKNPLITDVQARFLISFLHLVGDGDKKSKINFSHIKLSKSDLDTLRGDLRALKRFADRNVTHKFFGEK